MKDSNFYQKPTLEHLASNANQALIYKRFDFKHKNHQPIWHYHPEIEIVFVNEGAGKRQIGSHVSYYNDGDLICIGSNLPHCGFTDSFSNKRKETILQFLPNYLGEAFFDLEEMKPIKKFLEKAKLGLVFSGKTKKEVGKMIEKMQHKSPIERILDSVLILKRLQESTECQLLNANGFAVNAESQDNHRINKVMNYVQQHYKNPIPVEDIANHVNMTVPSFCRNFKKITGKTFTQFVNEYRLVHATKLLSEEQESVQNICYECGFNNFSHFNKLFKQHTGKTPTAYRKSLDFTISES